MHVVFQQGKTLIQVLLNRSSSIVFGKDLDRDLCPQSSIHRQVQYGIAKPAKSVLEYNGYQWSERSIRHHRP